MRRRCFADFPVGEYEEKKRGCFAAEFGPTRYLTADFKIKKAAVFLPTTEECIFISLGCNSPVATEQIWSCITRRFRRVSDEFLDLVHGPQGGIPLGHGQVVGNPVRGMAFE
jgi:hypothetical protein